MQMTRSGDAKNQRMLSGHRAQFPVALMILQVIAATFFVADGIEDQFATLGQGFSLDAAMECLIAVALLGGILFCAHYIAELNRELARNGQLLASAKGALADHIAVRFREWRLTPGESEVALFALKGCDVAEIARLRGAAAGTIRSQLSQVYAKSGVTSQAMLVSLFIEDLLNKPILEEREQHKKRASFPTPFQLFR